MLEGVDAYFSLCPGPIRFEVAVARASELLEVAAEQATRAFLAGRGRTIARRSRHDRQSFQLYLPRDQGLVRPGDAGRARRRLVCLAYRHLSRKLILVAAGFAGTFAARASASISLAVLLETRRGQFYVI